jgi:hypothetical protein
MDIDAVPADAQRPHCDIYAAKDAMSSLKDAILLGKDAAVSAAIKMHAGRYLSRYGEIRHVEVDSSNRSIEMDILLKGESVSIILRTAQYEIISENGESLFIPHDVSASREWIDSLAKEHIQDLPFRIPAALAKILTFCV